jgi:lipopolysaccharide/colanic/teichoic acid biosynthesis glycosyltransferase
MHERPSGHESGAAFCICELAAAVPARPRAGRPVVNATSYVAQAMAGSLGAGSLWGARDTLVLGLNKLAAALLLLLFSPLLAVVTFMIWRRDGAPVLFAHYRVGCDGKLFRCMKFRTMRRDAEQVLSDLLRDSPQARAEWASGQKLGNDPRITPVGRFLRSSSFDELPQLLNVLRGEMSLVGPRPITVAELTRYGMVRWHYLSVRPGMTGLWQVSGRNNTSYDERVALDKRYVEQRSFWFDVGILLRTVRVVVAREGAS